MKVLTTTVFLFLSTFLLAQNQIPQITSLTLNHSGDQELTITYDVTDAENDEVIVNLLISDNGGKSFRVNTTGATGDLNELQTVGSGKTIVWNYDGATETTGEYIIKLTVDDLQVIDIQEIVNQVDSNRLRSNLELIEGVRHRSTGIVRLQETRDFIEQTFIENDLQSEVQVFPFSALDGYNYIGTDLGTASDADVYVLTAHYDTVAGSPGADDNGSGTVGMLEAARILAPYQFKKSIRYIGFDLEETGLNGSRKYVSEGIPAGDNLVGVLNLEMIGYYTEVPNTQEFPNGFNLLYPEQYGAVEANAFRGDFVANIGKVNQNDWSALYASAAANYVPDLSVITFQAPSNWQAIAPDLGRSDHAPFWMADIPAVMITNTSEFRTPYYHEASDTIGHLNLTFMSNIVKAAVATLAEQAEIQHSSSVTASIELMMTPTKEIALCTIQLFPNPVKNKLNLMITNCDQAPSYAKLFSLDGHLIMEQQMISTSKHLQLDLQSLPKGVYFLETDLGREKLIKM